ncbi:MAG: hypothetical protein K2K48_08150, partial [Anaeroplasmataceae bacterium]|nr:hypothetical protein [Anaeroplasmataceae bacterium]
KMIFEINQEEHEKNVKRYEEDMRRLERDISYLKYYDGYYDGKDVGKSEANLTTAKRLKDMGSTDEFISEATGLSIEKVKAL